MNKQSEQLELKLALARAYSHYTNMSDRAFRDRDGALSCGAALRASQCAEVFREEFGLSNTDQAVAEIRIILKKDKA